MKPSRVKCYRKLSLMVLTLLCGTLSACGGDSSSDSPPSISVSVSADQQTLQSGSSAQITAIVSNDPSKGGVTWSVSCPGANCGSVSGTTTASGEPTTYISPTGITTPPTDLLVSITATSISNPAIKATTQVTVKGGVAITELDVDSTTVLAGSISHMRVALSNDSAQYIVSWSASCPTPPCGTFSPSTSTSGVWVTYTAPAAVPPTDLPVTIAARAGNAPAAQAADTITIPALAVGVTASESRVPAGTVVSVTATTNYPALATKGVAWTVQCGATDCGTVVPSSSASGVPVMYTAPTAVPLDDLTITLTANSVSVPAVKGSATLKVAAVGVEVVPVSALIPLGFSQQFIGNVYADPSSSPSSGVSWTLTQGATHCSVACGSFLPPATPNGGTGIYTAPGVLPAKATVTLTATSVVDQTKSATARVKLTTGTVQLVPIDVSFVKVKGRFPPPQTVTLTNTANSALTIHGITIGGANPSSFSQTNTCGNNVAPSSSCVITVSWHKSGTAVLSISDTSLDSPQQVQLSAGIGYEVTAAMRAVLLRQAAVASPPPSGVGRVGTRVLDLIDPSHADPYLLNGTRRELSVRLWYPAAADAACVAAQYTSPQVWSYFSTLIGVALPQVSTHSCLDAPMLAGVRPVVLLEHGFTGTYTDYTFLAEDLASRGYFVAAVDHTHEATAVEFRDGRLEESVFGSHLTQYARTDTGALGLAVAVRLDDLRFVLNTLQRLNAAPGGDFAGRLDLTRIALVGHSLGGLTTLRALESEPRFKAAVLLDGLVPPHFPKAIEQPVLNLVVGRERWNEDDCRLWDALHGPRIAVNLPGAEHIALSDAVWLLQGVVKSGASTPDRAIAAIRKYVAGFLDESLRDSGPGSWSTGSAHDPGALVATGAQFLCRPQ